MTDTPSNFVTIPKTLFFRMVDAIQHPLDLGHDGFHELMDDIEQWIPPATDEEIDSSFDAYR